MIKQYVSIILPCYNEKNNIIPLIEDIHKELDQCNHEIIVVDDNSPDHTYDAILVKNYPFVRVFLRTEDHGFAKSIRHGIEHSKGDYIVVMDSDFNHQPKYLPILLNNLQYYDGVFASRFVYGGKMNGKVRHLASWFFNIFVRILTRHYITDSLFGYFAINRDVLEKINFNEVFWGYGDYCIRLMYYLQENKANLLQIPAIIGKRLAGKGNRKFLSIFFLYTKETIKLAFKRKKHV